MTNKLVKGIAKVAVVTGAITFSYALGERIERLIKEDDSIEETDKPMITLISCTVAGYGVGLIARHIVKKM